MNSHNPDLLYWIAATYLPGVGPITFRRWLDQIPDIKALFSASATTLQAAGFSQKEIQILQQPDWEAAKRDLAWVEQPNRSVLTVVDAAYPTLLQEIPAAPLVLYVQGDVSLLSQPQIAMVGSRNPTISGKETAERFAYCLAKAGLVVTSGLALGVDAAGHRGALAASGKTIAVAGTGLNKIYPASHRGLAKEIAETGALVSEFSPDTPPSATNFPRRNRIISGLSLGVLVVEAAVRSGSLITARFAVEQGRDVFAVPGSIHNPLARGCHQLIQQGAKLVETAEAILEELNLPHAIVASIQPPKSPQLDKKSQSLLGLIGDEATPLDTILVRSRLTASEVSSMLLLLELNGHVKLVTGGYVRYPLN
jgi:DNA processing protein